MVTFLLMAPGSECLIGIFFFENNHSTLWLIIAFSVGQLSVFTIGGQRPPKAPPAQQFFSTDFNRLVWDIYGHTLDELLQQPPHAIPSGQLCDVDGSPLLPGEMAVTPFTGFVPVPPDDLAHSMARIQQLRGLLQIC